MWELRAREREFEILFLLNVEILLYTWDYKHKGYLHFDLKWSQTADREKHTLK